MKKTLSLFLSLMLVLAVFIGASVTASAASENDLKFELNADGVSYAVTGYAEGLSGTVTIPETYNGLPVTKLCDGAFEYADDITNIKIPDTVKVIGQFALARCGIESVTIPAGVTELQYECFFECLNLKSVTLPTSLKIIGDWAFSGCKSLETIYIPAGVESIGVCAFQWCDALKTVVIHKNVNTIKDSAFVNCNALTDVYYSGSEAEWSNIQISPYYNDALLNAKVHFNYDKAIAPKPTLEYINNQWAYVCGDEIIADYTGLVNYNDAYFYVENGIVNWNYIGLVAYRGEWFYVTNGVLDGSYTGLVQYGTDWYYIQNGWMNPNYTGLVECEGSWYYVQNSWMNPNYTGLVEYAGDWYYVQSGWMNLYYTGLVEYAGDWYYVQNGWMNSSYTGLVEYSGDWYYVQNGWMNSSYTGLVEYAGDWYYVQSGWMNPYYTGIVEYEGSLFYVTNAWLNWGYNGIVEYDGKTYSVVNGVADLFTKEEILAMYQNAAKDIAENGSAGYNKKAWQSSDGLSFTNSFDNLLRPLVEAFMTKEENAEVQVSEKGSDDSKNRMPMSNCTADMVESARLEAKGGNYLITIVMKEQVNPEKTDTDGIAVMSDNILYASDVIETVKTDNTLKPIIKEVNNLTLDYKEYTIQAEMTKDGKLVNITQIGVMDATADAKLVLGSTQCEGTITFNTVYSDFQY